MDPGRILELINQAIIIKIIYSNESIINIVEQINNVNSIYLFLL